jgi:hypothetical protein
MDVSGILFLVMYWFEWINECVLTWAQRQCSSSIYDLAPVLKEIEEVVIGSLFTHFTDQPTQPTESRCSVPLWTDTSLPIHPQNDREGG